MTEWDSAACRPGVFPVDGLQRADAEGEKTAQTMRSVVAVEP